MTPNELLESQKIFFSTGCTRDIQFRKQYLSKLYDSIQRHQNDIASALSSDLGKPPFESYATETGSVLSDISYLKKHISSWSKPHRVPTPLVHFPAASTVYAEPFGTVLIMAPWNYPFMLLIEPLAEAIAAGNTAVIKPSAQSPATAQIISTIIQETFPAQYVACVTGGHDINDELLSLPFDFIFFTGSAAVGKKVLKAAADHLTPVCLELGGKNPCIVDTTADIQLCARRIVWSKFMNAGQTCVAPDYILVHEAKESELAESIQKEIALQYGKDPLSSPSLARIINDKHFDRLTTLAPYAACNRQTLRIAPTLIRFGSLKKAEEQNTQNSSFIIRNDSSIKPSEALMDEELFGPLLPLITYSSIDDVISFISKRNTPLALYVFSTDKRMQKLIISSLRFGSGAINDAVVQLATPYIPFGGIGQSGMGAYHGKTGFDTFTHYKGILTKSNALDITLRYPPYDGKLALLKRFLQ